MPPATDADHPTDHHYATSLRWSGSTGAGYDAYPRTHTLTAPPAAQTLELASDPAFRGNAELLNPEQLLVAAASSCQLLAFLAVAARARVDVVGYVDDATATMPTGDLPMRITRIELRPVITVRGEVSEDRLARLVELGHRECFIANSLRSDVVVVPTFSRAG